MRNCFSDKEAAILLGATLMHWGVHFHSSTKRELTDEQQSQVDAAAEKIMTSRMDAGETQLSDEEVALLIDVVEDCLAECGNNASELSLHLKADSRTEVESLLSRLVKKTPSNA